MNIEEKINNYPRFSQHIGLERINKLLKALDLKQAPYPFIHIAGTKGKGSTAVFLANILHSAGYKVGLFTSPHLQSVNERICIDLQAINHAQLDNLYNQVHQVVQDLNMFDISYFELITAMALLEFKLKNTDIVVLETGLGGRLDATNALSNPVLTILTSIGLDHVDRLGTTIEDIAREKAAIIKPGASVVSAPQKASVESIIQEKASLHQVRHYSVYRDYQISSYPSRDIKKERFDILSYITGIPYKDIVSSLAGKHQAMNASLALAGSELLTKKGVIIREQHIRSGIYKAFWPGRFEMIKVKDRLMILDGAHNPDSSKALADTIRERFPEKKIHLLFASLSNKLIEENLKQLAQIASSFYFTEIAGHASINPEELVEWSAKYLPEIPAIADKDPWICFMKALDNMREPEDMICITGSLYYIGWLRSKLDLPFYLENGKELLEVNHV